MLKQRHKLNFRFYYLHFQINRGYQYHCMHLASGQLVLLHLSCLIFFLYAKSWRGAGSRRGCHRAPKLNAQMWSSVQKVTPFCSMMESQRKKSTWLIRALARKSPLESKTCRHRCVYNTNYCGETVFLPEAFLALNHCQKPRFKQILPFCVFVRAGIVSAK